MKSTKFIVTALVAIGALLLMSCSGEVTDFESAASPSSTITPPEATEPTPTTTDESTVPADPDRFAALNAFISDNASYRDEEVKVADLILVETPTPAVAIRARLAAWNQSDGSPAYTMDLLGQCLVHEGVLSATGTEDSFNWNPGFPPEGEFEFSGECNADEPEPERLDQFLQSQAMSFTEFDETGFTLTIDDQAERWVTLASTR